MSSSSCWTIWVAHFSACTPDLQILPTPDHPWLGPLQLAPQTQLPSWPLPSPLAHRVMSAHKLHFQQQLWMVGMAGLKGPDRDEASTQIRRSLQRFSISALCSVPCHLMRPDNPSIAILTVSACWRHQAVRPPSIWQTQPRKHQVATQAANR